MSEAREQLEARAERFKDFAENAPGRKTFNEFRDFILRGNVVDLAVGVAVGAAFTAVVTALVANVFTPLIGVILPGDGLFDEAKWDIPKVFGPGVSPILYGKFINAIISFLIIAAVIFFFVVKPVNHLLAKRKVEPEVESVTKECPECLSSIPAAAKRCAFCASEQPEAA